VGIFHLYLESVLSRLPTKSVSQTQSTSYF
jgi:hypothetical protein